MIKDTVSAVKALFAKRSLAYRRVFRMDDVDSVIVLKDLAKFCRAHESTYHADPRIHAAMEGRKEVWLRLQNYLNLNSEELYRLHMVKDMAQGDKK